MPSHGRELPCTKLTALRPTQGPTPAPQITFHYGLSRNAPDILLDMVKFMTSIIFRTQNECLPTLYVACQELHCWGAHVSTIQLGMHITWTLWKHVLVPMWDLNWDLCSQNSHGDSDDQVLQCQCLVVRHVQRYLLNLNGKKEQQHCTKLMNDYKERMGSKNIW